MEIVPNRSELGTSLTTEVETNEDGNGSTNTQERVQRGYSGDRHCDPQDVLFDTPASAQSNKNNKLLSFLINTTAKPYGSISTSYRKVKFQSPPSDSSQFRDFDKSPRNSPDNTFDFGTPPSRDLHTKDSRVHDDNANRTHNVSPDKSEESMNASGRVLYHPTHEGLLNLGKTTCTQNPSCIISSQQESPMATHNKPTQNGLSKSLENQAKHHEDIHFLSQGGDKNSITKGSHTPRNVPPFNDSKPSLAQIPSLDTRNHTPLTGADFSDRGRRSEKGNRSRNYSRYDSHPSPVSNKGVNFSDSSIHKKSEGTTTRIPLNSTNPCNDALSSLYRSLSYNNLPCSVNKNKLSSVNSHVLALPYHKQFAADSSYELGQKVTYESSKANNGSEFARNPASNSSAFRSVSCPAQSRSHSIKSYHKFKNKCCDCALCAKYNLLVTQPCDGFHSEVPDACVPSYLPANKLSTPGRETRRQQVQIGYRDAQAVSSEIKAPTQSNKRQQSTLFRSGLDAQENRGPHRRSQSEVRSTVSTYDPPTVASGRKQNQINQPYQSQPQCDQKEFYGPTGMSFPTGDRRLWQRSDVRPRMSTDRFQHLDSNSFSTPDRAIKQKGQSNFRFDVPPAAGSERKVSVQPNTQHQSSISKPELDAQPERRHYRRSQSEGRSRTSTCDSPTASSKRKPFEVDEKKNKGPHWISHNEGGSRPLTHSPTESGVSEVFTENTSNKTLRDKDCEHFHSRNSLNYKTSSLQRPHKIYDENFIPSQSSFRPTNPNTAGFERRPFVQSGEQHKYSISKSGLDAQRGGRTHWRSQNDHGSHTSSQASETRRNTRSYNRHDSHPSTVSSKQNKENITDKNAVPYITKDNIFKTNSDEFTRENDLPRTDNTRPQGDPKNLDPRYGIQSMKDDYHEFSAPGRANTQPWTPKRYPGSRPSNTRAATMKHPSQSTPHYEDTAPHNLSGSRASEMSSRNTSDNIVYSDIPPRSNRGQLKRVPHNYSMDYMGQGKPQRGASNSAASGATCRPRSHATCDPVSTSHDAGFSLFCKEINSQGNIEGNVSSVPVENVLPKQSSKSSDQVNMFPPPTRNVPNMFPPLKHASSVSSLFTESTSGFEDGSSRQPSMEDLRQQSGTTGRCPIINNNYFYMPRVTYDYRREENIRVNRAHAIGINSSMTSSYDYTIREENITVNRPRAVGINSSMTSYEGFADDESESEESVSSDDAKTI